MVETCEEMDCGMERDLSKCYDVVPHEVAREVLMKAEVPEMVLALMMTA